MSEEKKQPEYALDDKEVTITFTIKEINVLLNILNRPLGIDTVTLAKCIDTIQERCADQIGELLKNESKAAS
jgi:septin family protein